MHLVSVNSTFKNIVIDNLLDKMKPTHGNAIVHIFSKQHIEHYILALDMFKQKLFYKNFKVLLLISISLSLWFLIPSRNFFTIGYQ